MTARRWSAAKGEVLNAQPPTQQQTRAATFVRRRSSRVDEARGDAGALRSYPQPVAQTSRRCRSSCAR